MISKSDVTALANSIKALFFNGSPFEWKKGKEMCCYANWSQGYQLQVLCRSKAEGVRVIQQILQIQGHAYSGKNLTHNVTDAEAEAYPTIPSTINVLGKSVKTPRRRPVANVSFRCAFLKLQFYPQDIVLVNEYGEITPNLPNI